MPDRAKAKAAAVVRSLPSIRTRRRRTGTAAAAYSHALRMTNDPAISAQIAVTALKRGAQSRTAVLAHARHLAFGTPSSQALDPATVDAASDLKSLAVQLAGTRPAVERAIVDLELRYGLDQSDFAKSLGLSNSRAQVRAQDVTKAWAETLDPAMMAALGAGSCQVLNELLTERQIFPVLSQDHTPPFGTPAAVGATGTEDLSVTPAFQSVTVGRLVQTSPEILEHASNCEVCSVRLKRLTPVRSLVGQLPAEPVPPLVGTAAKAGRRRLPAPLPPSIEPKRFDLYRLKNVAAAGGALVLCSLILVGGYSAVASNEGSQADRVQRLIEQGPRSSLLGTPSIIGPATTTASLANTSDNEVSWNATSTVPWLSVQPASGVLNPSQNVTLFVRVDSSSANNADQRGSISIVANDGSKQVLEFRNDD